MRTLAGSFMILIAAMVGAVEFRALSDRTVAENVAKMFAEHDPFQPRLPWDVHVIFTLLFLVLLASGLRLIFVRKHGRSDI